jgi:hypothetical protein
MNVSGQSGGSSLLEMEPRTTEMHPDARYVGKQSTRIVTGDAAGAQFVSPTSRIALKLDVQGFELEALLGAPRLLRRALLVECELLLEPMYAKQAGAEALISHLYAAGLRLAGTEPGYVDESTGAFAWMDAIFIRDPA